MSPMGNNSVNSQPTINGIMAPAPIQMQVIYRASMSPWVIIQSTLNPPCCGQCKKVQAYVHQNCIFQLVYQVLDIVTRCRLIATNALLNCQPGCEQCKKVHAYTHQQCIAQLILPGLVRCDKVQAYAPPTMHCTTGYARSCAL